MKKKLFAMIPLIVMCLFLFAKTGTRAAEKKLILEKTYTETGTSSIPVPITKPSHLTFEYSSSDPYWERLQSWEVRANDRYLMSQENFENQNTTNAKMECWVYGNKQYVLKVNGEHQIHDGKTTIRVYAEEVEGLTCGYDQKSDLNKLKTLNATDVAKFFVGDDYDEMNDIDEWGQCMVTLKEDGILTLTSSRKVQDLRIVEDPVGLRIGHFSPQYASKLSAHLKKGTYFVGSQIDKFIYDEEARGPYTVSMSFTPKPYVEKETTKKTTAASSKTTSKAAAIKYTPAKPSKIRLNRKKNAFVISFGKVKKATGYQIQCSKNKAFKKAKSKKTKKNISGFSKLKKGKYYVRVRSYRTVLRKTYYSKWVVKTIVVK